MARTVDTIQNQIIQSVQDTPEFAPLIANTSKRSIWRLWTYVVAAAQAILEQLIDTFKADIEATAAKAPPASPLWLQDKAFKFQYDADVPQIIQLVNLVPQYPIVDATKCIVSQCSVKTDVANNVIIKVAKGTPPQALASAELSAIQGYFNTIGAAGIRYVVRSSNPDKIYIGATIYYQGQYSAVIVANVQTAINNFLSSFQGVNFDGTIKMSDLENTVRNVTGVNDVVLNNIKVRKDSDDFSVGAYLVQNSTILSRLWNSFSGYVVTETTTGNTINESLTFISE